MTHILCPDLAPEPVDSLLRDLRSSDNELTLFLEAILIDTNIEDFGDSSTARTTSINGCEAITILVQCKILDQEVREAALRKHLPHEDFTEVEFETWDGVLLAIQFASEEVIDRICHRIPIEFIAGAISVLNPEAQERARSIFYQ